MTRPIAGNYAHKILGCLAIAAMVASLLGAAESEAAKRAGFERLLEWQALPAPPAEASPFYGGFAGVSGPRFLVVDGSPTRGIWAFMPAQEGGWERLGALEVALEPGTALGGTEGLLCLGGPKGAAPGAVVRLRWDATAGRLIQEALPALPAGSQPLNAARMGDKVYALLAGGNSPSANPPVLWSLDLSRPERWNEVAAVPAGLEPGVALSLINISEPTRH
jgi:hypothetical protein